MPIEPVDPIAEQAETTAEQFRDPFGPPPEDMPDPLPDDITPTEEHDQTSGKSGMAGEAPTG